MTGMTCPKCQCHALFIQVSGFSTGPLDWVAHPARKMIFHLAHGLTLLKELGNGFSIRAPSQNLVHKSGQVILSGFQKLVFATQPKKISGGEH
jgi:hypothetical protein